MKSDSSPELEPAEPPGDPSHDTLSPMLLIKWQTVLKLTSAALTHNERIVWLPDPCQ